MNHILDTNFSHNTLVFLQKKFPSMMIISIAMSNPTTPNVANYRHVPSVCSLVASVDPDCTKWVHSIRIQSRGNELVEGLESMLFDALIMRKKLAGKSELPDKLIVLRDGVSEGKMEDVYIKEIQKIVSCFTNMGQEAPSVTAFLALKNHQLRFWDADPRNSHLNLPPGTWIAESGVHHCKHPNFYLLSHAGIKGMSRPMRYFMIQDQLTETLELQTMALQFWASFLYQQCYAYQR